MNSYKSFRVDTRERITTVTLNRPQTVNAISVQFMDELALLCAELATDPDTRSVIITANGRGFCSGLDVNLFGQVGGGISFDELPSLVEKWQAAFDALANLPQLTVAAINGITLGAGVELILCADFRIASTRALFGMPEVQFGIIPDLGGIPRLVRTVGSSWAKEIVFRGRNFSAMEALRVGLVNRVADHGDLMGQARKWAGQFASLPPSAAREAKRLINASSDMDMAAVHAAARQAQLGLLASPEFRAAVQALREERGGEKPAPEPPPEEMQAEETSSEAS